MMTYEVMMEMFENGYTFVEEIIQNGEMNKFSLADLEEIIIIDYVVYKDQKLVLIHGWDWN